MNDLPENENLSEEQNVEVTGKDDFSTVFSNPAEHNNKAELTKKKRRLPVIIASLLAVAVLVGGTVAVIKLIPEREDENTSSSDNTIKVLDLKSDDFKYVTVTNTYGTFKLYSETEKAETTSSSDTSSTTDTVNWYLDGYKKEVVSTTAVKSIADNAAAIIASREVTAKTAAECGLEKPNAKIDVVTNDDANFSVLVGAKSPDNTGTYLMLSTDEKIYLVEDTTAENFNFDPLTLANTDAIAGIDASNFDSKYKDDSNALSSFDSITVKGKNFPDNVVITPNNDTAMSQYAAFMTTSPTKRIAENVDGIFDLFKSGLQVTGAYSFDASDASISKLKLNTPDLDTNITLGNYKLNYKFALQEDGNYAVWYTGCTLIKKVAASSLPFIGYKTTDFYASWVCLQSIDDLSNFTIKTTDKTYSFDIVHNEEEDAEETYVITHNGKKLVAEEFQDFYQTCISLPCADYTVDKVTGDPEMTIIFTYNDKSRGKSSVEFRKASETKYQYKVDGMDMGKVTSAALNKILKNLEKVSAGETAN